MGNNDSSFTDILAQNMSPLQADFALFHHRDLLTSSDTEKPWKQEKLVNKLNHLNFIDGFFFLIFRDNNGKYFLAKAYPLPCVKDELLCRLTSPEVTNNIPNYKFDFLMIDDGLTAVLAPIQLISAENDIIKLSLPDHSNVKKLRKTRRHKCEDIDCRLSQDGFEADGKLIDFTPTAMGVRLSLDGSTASFDIKNPVELTLSNKGQILYSGPCCCIRNGINSYDGKIVLAPLVNHIERFPKRKMRNPRQQISPSFVLRFMHPFFQKNIERDIKEISTAGFSIVDGIEEEILLPGMIIPEISIIYSGVLKIPCSAQVLYRREDTTNNTLQAGLTFADMDIKSYSNLNHILGAYIDSNARVSTEVDMDSLWEFFFDTGFIYGEKYEHLYSYRHDFRRTYEKLYRNNPDIARHFIYEKNGKIYGHIAMVHAFNPSWVIQHFSAKPLESKVTSIIILKQITSYINSFHRFPSGGMNYVMTFYQPNNKVVDTIFGGFARYLNNLKGSSLDLFSYMLFSRNHNEYRLNSEWDLTISTDEGYNKLVEFYNNYSNGLMLDSFDLLSSTNKLSNKFDRLGLERNIIKYCLFYKSKLVAFFILNKSNLGLNLSDILNSITVLIVDKTKLNIDILFSIISRLAKFYKEITIPLLIYPHDYLYEKNVAVEKKYQLWILNNNPFSDDFTDYMNKKFRMRYDKI